MKASVYKQATANHYIKEPAATARVAAESQLSCRSVLRPKMRAGTCNVPRRAVAAESQLRGKQHEDRKREWATQSTAAT
eukprot:8374035-Karenia_brevis.AAC.1